MDTQGKTNIMDIQGKENTMDIQEKGSSMGIQGRESIAGIQGEGSSVDIQGEGSSVGIPGKESIVGIQRKGKHHGDTGGSTIARIHWVNGTTETPGESPADGGGGCGCQGCAGGRRPADGGGQTPGAHPAVMALEVMDALLGALAPRGPLFEKASRRALARIEGIARRDPRALLGLRALLARLSRALGQQRDLHAQVESLAEDLGEALAESCAAPRDMRTLAEIAGRARGLGLAYQSLYDLILACDARCGALLHRWAER